MKLATAVCIEHGGNVAFIFHSLPDDTDVCRKDLALDRQLVQVGKLAEGVTNIDILPDGNVKLIDIENRFAILRLRDNPFAVCHERYMNGYALDDLAFLFE